MSELWVVNASPVIVLARGGYLHLLTELARKVLIPDAVVGEILAGPESDSARRALEAGWGKRITVGTLSPAVVEWSLGGGESAVLSLVLERGDCTAVLDDAEGRRCARTLGIPVIGTLGVIILAKRRNLITSAADVLRRLMRSGLFMDEMLVKDVVKLAGEDSAI